jgi:hypothetical protein
MRLIFALVFIAGLAAGIAYPFFITNFSGHAIGEWRVYERGSGFKPATMSLSETDAPVRALVDLTTLGTPRLSGDRTALTVTASVDGRTVLADTLSFVHSEPRNDSPQSGQRVYRDLAGMFETIENGEYTFTVGPGDADGIEMKSVDLILRSGAVPVDPRLQPIGFMLMAVGVIGFVIAMRRGGQPPNPNSQPPAPRWGRDASKE